jgi:hypothetical protein
MNAPSDRSDDRIPLRFATAEAAGPHEALLLDETLRTFLSDAGRAVARFRETAGRPTHAPGCVCCTGRGAAVAALGGLFNDRAIGRVPWFTGVVAVVADPAAVAEALRADRVAAARFRVEG